MQLVPLQAVPNQELNVLLADQNCTVKVYQRFYGLFVDLYVDDSPIVIGVIAQNINRIVRSVYLGFEGDLVFADSQGTDDPYYTGLANRFEFLYLSTTDLQTLKVTG